MASVDKSQPLRSFQFWLQFLLRMIYATLSHYVQHGIQSLPSRQPNHVLTAASRWYYILLDRSAKETAKIQRKLFFGSCQRIDVEVTGVMHGALAGPGFQFREQVA